MTYLAIPTAANNYDITKQQMNLACQYGAEILELRVDYLENLSADLVTKLVTEIKSEKPKLPLIITCRDFNEGGNKDYPIELRSGVLLAALEAGADFIDFEYQNFMNIQYQEKIRQALLQNPKARLIISAHNFKTKFDDIKKLFHEITTQAPRAIPKLIYTANHINDCFEAFDLLKDTGGDRIVFCMGQAGLISRIIAKKLGSFVTFTSLEQKSATAPGQLSIDQFKNLYRYDIINNDTELYGVIADPVAHSLSPAIHNASFAEEKMNRIYLPLLLQGGQDEFNLFLNNLLVRKWLNFRGFSVTIPHKQNALNYVISKKGTVEPVAEKIGAVNTIITSSDSSIRAYNTDYSGAMDAITAGMNIDTSDLNGLSVAVIGAGGVAKAIVAGLSSAGAEIKIYNRTVEKAEKLANEFNCGFAPLGKIKNINVSLVINCTSIGMYPNTEASPIPSEYITDSMTVFDTVYNPAETMLLRQAKEKGAKTIDGISMFVNQAMGQFKLFTGREAQTELLRKTISNYL